MKKIPYLIVLAVVFIAGFVIAKLTVVNKAAVAVEKSDDGHGHEESEEEAHAENGENTVKLSPESQKAAGIQFTKTKLTSFKGEINATGQINNDDPSSVQIRPEAEGVVKSCGIMPGENIMEGQKLCVIEGKNGDFEVKSPLTGTVISSFAVPGTAVDRISALHIVADLSSLNASFDVSEKDINGVRIGQRVLVKVHGKDTEEFYGKVTFISPSVDNETRMVKVGVSIKNTAGRLKLGMFVKGLFEVEKQGAFIVIPRDAAQYSGGKRIAFVKTGDEKFEMRELKVADETYTELAVVSGIKHNEQIVSAGGFLLKSEFFKSKMGAGCAD